MKPGWRAAALNDGWTYRDRVLPANGGILVSHWLANHYPHSGVDEWRQRIALGEISLNDSVLSADRELLGGESLCWHRPPWLEEAIPD